MRFRWSYSPEYYYGWAVLPFAAYLMHQRLGFMGAGRPPGRLTANVLGALGLLSGLVLAFSLLCLEGNPLWTMMAWAGAAGAFAIWLALLGAGGGMPWIRHGLAPGLFLFTALPLPSVIYVPLIETLKQTSAWLSAETVTMLGYPALVHGAVIEVGRGFVGVNEACAGLLSLQTVVMCAFFFGELQMRSLLVRVRLLVSAVVIALVVNWARTAALTYLAATQGGEAVDRWHDTAGAIEMVVSLILIYVASEWRRADVALANDPVDATVRGVNGWSLAVLSVLGAGVIGIQAWYYYNEYERAELNPVSWTLHAESEDWQSLELHPSVVKALQCDDYNGMTWIDPQSSRTWIAYRLHWGTDPMATYDISGHNPALCLGNSGAILDADLGVCPILVDGAELPTHMYRFRVGTQRFYVFFALFDTGGRRLKSEPGRDITAARWRVVRDGQRRIDLTLVTFAFSRVNDDLEAHRIATEMANRIIEVGR